MFFSWSAAFINHLQKEQHSSGLFLCENELRGIGCNLEKRKRKQSCCCFISQSVKWAEARTTVQSSCFKSTTDTNSFTVRKGEKTVSYQESLLEVIAVFYNYGIQVICLCCEGFGSSPRHDIPL